MTAVEKDNKKMSEVKGSFLNCINLYEKEANKDITKSYRKELYDAFNKEWKAYANKVMRTNNRVKVDIFAFERSVNQNNLIQ